MYCLEIEIFFSSIAMIVVGDQYNTLDTCSIEGVLKVLEVMGGLLLFIAILNIMIGLSFCTAVECGTICGIASLPIMVVTGLAQFGIQIWASVVVFGMSFNYFLCDSFALGFL